MEAQKNNKRRNGYRGFGRRAGTALLAGFVMNIAQLGAYGAICPLNVPTNDNDAILASDTMLPPPAAAPAASDSAGSLGDTSSMDAATGAADNTANNGQAAPAPGQPAPGATDAAGAALNENSATTQPSDTMMLPDNEAHVLLEPGKARTLNLGHKIKTANILDKDIADIIMMSPNQVLVTGKKPGTTQLILWDDGDGSHVVEVTVQSNIINLRRTLAQLFPGEKIQADAANGTVTLHGQVNSLQVAQEAAQVSLAYGKVLNLLEVGGGQQVMLQVKFAEVSKQAERQLGLNFGGVDGVSFLGSNLGPDHLGIGPNGNFGSTISGDTIASAATIASPIFGQGMIGKTVFQYFVNALETNSVLRILAEPNLVTTSGQEATFLAGGSFPYPVPQAGANGQTTITIEFQDYGVNLKFTPIVLGDGRIRLKVAPEVSQLDYSHGVSLDGTTVPGLTKRNVNTCVEMAEGQTLAIAGLLQNNITADNTQLPVLGDLPILGALFRSVSYQRAETELVILVTPVLVGGIDPADVTEVPGGKWRDPASVDLYLFKDLGGEQLDTTNAPRLENSPAPRFHGQYGFQPASPDSSASAR